jgi:hypothetical protein
VAEDAYITIFDRDGSSNPLKVILDEDKDGVTYGITGSGQVSEHEFTFEGSMGETICRHPTQCPDFYFTQFETSDGTLRLPPAVTNVSSLDIAYTPITMWEDFDSDGDRAFYIEYRDTTTTPDIIIKKYRVTDDALVDTEVSTTQGGAAQETAPRIGKVASFEGNTFVPAGDESGSNHIRKIAVGDISAGTADTYTEGDSGFSNSHAVIDEDGVANFIICSKQNYRLAATTPTTDANFGPNVEVGDSGSPIIWTLESGGFVYFCKPENLYEGDPTSARVLLDMRAERKNKVFQTYDDFDGHMATTVGAAVLYPHRSGFWRYRKGAAINLSIDNIPGYREVAGISDIPIGLRHYATDAVGQWVYAIYKPPGFSNASNCNIMSALYEPGAARELTWRTLMSRNEDLLGLYIDSDKRLNFIQNPNDPAIAAASVAFVSASSAASNGSASSLTISSHTIASGSQRALFVGISSVGGVDSGGVRNAPSSVRFGNQFMAEVVKIVKANSGNTAFLYSSIWQLAAPLVSTADITIVFPNLQTGIAAGATNCTGVDQALLLQNTKTATGESTTPSITIASQTNDLVLDNVAEFGAVTTAPDSGDERYDDAAGSVNSVAGSTEAGAASVQKDWTLGSSVRWAHVGGTIRKPALGVASAALNYIQLNLDGSPRTALGRDRGAASSSYEHYTGEIRFDRRMQARYMKVETENFDSTTSLQMSILRDGDGGSDIGSAITSDDFHQIDFTVGTTDLLRRARMRLTLDTNSSYAPTVSDPRTLRAVLGIRSPDTYKAIMRTGHSIDSAKAERKILRQRKGAGTVTITESWSGTQFRADVVGLRDLETRKEANGQMMYRTEITFERHDVEN